MLIYEINVSRAGNIRNMWALGKLRNIVSTTKMFLNLFGKIIASREAKFCVSNNVSGGEKTGKHRKHVSATMFPGLRRAFVLPSATTMIIILVYFATGNFISRPNTKYYERFTSNSKCNHYCNLQWNHVGRREAGGGGG